MSGGARPSVCKALEDTGIKLDCVATDILGKSGTGHFDSFADVRYLHHVSGGRR